MKRFAESCVDERQRWTERACVHCGDEIETASITREHVPSKCLLMEPYPEELVTVAACGECNTGFSRDEEYLSALLTAVLAGSTGVDRQKTLKAGRMFERQAGLRARIADSRTETKALDGETEITFWPEMDRVSRVMVKNARGHAVYELDRWTLEEPEYVTAFPLRSLSQKGYEQFEAGQSGIVKWPEVGTRMFQRVVAAWGSEKSELSGAWVIVQDDVYRYAVVDQGHGLLVRSVIREYLATEVYWSDRSY